ncbi:flap endonuclease GEN homolog 1 isoform X2 [Tamandua tetradactyla]|uniref:flap endonuclease GEN homolog 1 isoform X2 n=1 Tax=Tamandua tetradactyla TaxID=48850 RepID=UPI004053BB6D
MGVNDLWQILEPVKEHHCLHSLGGKTIAVDLSLWVCEAQMVKKMMGRVTKPQLRNLFFRVSFLTLMDVKLVFVMEGEPPILKADVINKRNQNRYGPSGKMRFQKTGRSHFKSVLRECLDMLNCLGIPWVQAAGEAEAMCAYLNANGYVDGCLTNDGDAFLYGAQTVYRNFTMNTKDPHVDCYKMSSVQSKLGLNRDALVGLAVLLGCDYLPKGVPGVGKEQALKLIQILKGQSLLQRFNQWNEKSCYSDPQLLVAKNLAHCSVCSHPGSPKDHEHNGCKLCESDGYCLLPDGEFCPPSEWHCTESDNQPSALENSIRKKACSCEGFPFHEVIQEFLLTKDELVKRFTLEKMEWPNHYACEKLLVLLTHYDMIERKLGRKNSNQLQPIRIVKNRIRNGVHCFEIEWEKPEHYVTEDEQYGELALRTVEEESLFEAAYPEIVASYQKQKLEKNGKRQKSTRIKPKGNYMPKESDDTMSFSSHVTLKPTCESFPKQNSKLNMEISPDSRLPQESISESMNSLLLPQDASHVNPQEELRSPSPLTIPQIKTISKSFISESSQPNISPHNISVIADLHLSTIDWEGTSFSNSPPIPGNAFPHQSKSELKAAISNSFENIPEHRSHESQQCTTNIRQVLDWNLHKASFEEHLLSGITHLQLQDLPLKERIRLKSSYSLDNVQPDTDLRTLSLCGMKEPCIANSSSPCRSRLSKGLPGIHLQNESRNSKVLKGDQLFQKSYEVNTSISHSVHNPVVKASSVRIGLPDTTLNHGRKVNDQSTGGVAAKKTVCLDRYSSDEESVPAFGKAKYTTEEGKQCSQKYNLFQFEKSDTSRLSNPQTHVEESEQRVQAPKTAGHEEKRSSDPAQSSLNFLQCQKEKDDSHTCLDSPLPLCQRLKLRFQSA